MVIEINSNTLISSKKYKTIKDIQNAPIKSAIQCITRMKDSNEKEYLCKWLFNKHYLHIKQTGPLTNRIKNINNKICFNYLCKEYFNGFDINKCISNEILPKKSSDIIKKLNLIQSSLTGTYVDYLMRRMISEINQSEFDDRRIKTILYKNNQIIYRDNLWKFHIKNDSAICIWNMFEEPTIESETIGIIENNHTFIELSRKNEWLNIKYEDKIGWVRYKIPQTLGNPLPIEGNLSEYIDNPWFKNIGRGHICSKGCKCVIASNNPWQETLCRLNYCQYECYHKVKNTGKYKIEEVIKDIFIVSLCHSECFGGCPNQDKLDLILNEISDPKFYEDFIIPLYEYCKQLILNKKEIHLNPVLGSEKNMIPADCDLIIDDMLIDIKCTKGTNTIYEILQLIGYSSLNIDFIPRYGIPIKKISIINILEGIEYIYDISNISNKSLLDYLKILQGNTMIQ